MRSRLPSLVTLSAGLLAGCDTPATMVTPPAPLVFGTDSSATAYFGTPVNWGDTVWLGFTAKGLFDMREPSLHGATVSEGTSILRFLWRQSFHPEVVVRVTRSTAGCSVVTSIWHPERYRLREPGTAGVDIIPPMQLRSDSAQQPSALCDSLAVHIERVGLNLRGPHLTGRGLDGADWIFERLDASGHATRISWSPDCSTACDVFTAGMAFLKAGNALPAGPHELY